MSSNKKTTTPFEIGKLFLKAKYSFYSTLVFFIFANPETFSIFQRIFGNIVSFTVSGIPTLNGLLIHSVLFFITMLSLMLIPYD